MKMRKMCNILAVVTVLLAVGAVLVYGKKVQPSVNENTIVKTATTIENTTITDTNDMIKLSINK